MPVQLIQCPTCGATYRTEDYASNRRYRCPNCNCKFMVPGDDLHDELIGRVVGGCRIVAKIGEGGMGRIYKATHEALKKRVAIKILPDQYATNERYVTRFLREARSAARVEHPNIVSVLNVGEDQGYHFIIMQYIEGTDLDTIVKERGRLMPDEALRIIEQAAKGLAEIEKIGLVHRDIKPSNIMVTAGGHVFITDFGLARSAVERDDITPAGKVVGTPYFMSPEQCEGRLTDIRGDIYALGATFYYILTGRKPFEGDTNQVVIYKHRFVDLIPPNAIYNDIPQSLSNIICRMMAKKPDDRYASVQDLLTDLMRIEQEIQFDTAAAVARLGQMVPAQLTGSTTVIIPTATAPKKWAMPAMVGGIIGGIALLVLLIVVLVGGGGPEERPVEFVGQWRRTVEAFEGQGPRLFALGSNPLDRHIYVAYPAADGEGSVVRTLEPEAAGADDEHVYRGLPGRIRVLSTERLTMADDKGADFVGLTDTGEGMALFKYREKAEPELLRIEPRREGAVGLPPYMFRVGFFRTGVGGRQAVWGYSSYVRAPRSEVRRIGLSFLPQGDSWRVDMPGVTHVSPWMETVQGRTTAHILLVRNGEVEQINPETGAAVAWRGGQVPESLANSTEFAIEYAFVIDGGRRVSPVKRVLYMARRGGVNDTLTTYSMVHDGRRFLREAVAHSREYLFLADLDGALLEGWREGIEIDWAIDDASPVVLGADVDADGANEIVVNPGAGQPTYVFRESGYLAARKPLGRLLGVDQIGPMRRDLLFVEDGDTLFRYRVRGGDD